MVSRFTHLDGFVFAGANLSVTTMEGQPPQSTFPAIQNGQSNGGLADRISRPQGQSQRQNPFGKRATSDTMPKQQQERISRQKPSTKRLPVQAGRFIDSDGVAEKFLRAFFPLYDTNREQVLKDFYDDDSTFSLSVQMRSRRTRTRQQIDWSSYIKYSRNLMKLRNPQAKAEKRYQGQFNIFEVWTQLPKTQHPSVDGHVDEWIHECTPINNLPDPTGKSGGVTGLMATVHAAFEDTTTDGKTTMRSFTRTFVIGPATTELGVRVISDMLVLRPYTSNFAALHNSRPHTPNPPVPNGNSSLLQPQNSFNVPIQPNNLTPNTLQLNPPPPSNPIQPNTQPPHPEVVPGSGVGELREGKPEEQLQKERMVLQLSFATKLKLAVADQCLTGNNWNMEAAMANVQQLTAEGKLGPDAFLNV